MRNLRFCIAYAELEKLMPSSEGDDDVAWKRRLFREELTGFHHCVANNVTHEDVMNHARESLRLAWKDCVSQDDVANENWERIGPEDVRVGVLNDLQLVAPGIWIGSTDTLTDSHILDERDIQHLVYCTTTQGDTRITDGYTSISCRAHHVVKLFDLPRQQLEDLLADVDGVEQLKTISSTSCSEFIHIASVLNSLIVGKSGMLLYCDNGISTSIAMCAALLMTRYKFPLHIVMPLIKAARRDTSQSKHLSFQLEQIDFKE
ncbi:hypothetical protein PHMEG_00018713 [Phytophthora megakarya]|uniref:Uncharacterized protein n=1 Tax=Phytophthora megakarya TaxID=4795 RepID=A0A225VUP2_9STRA|nr:hypothetical protein PHMEG_00018713 [Phytophthora megakarya]